MKFSALLSLFSSQILSVQQKEDFSIENIHWDHEKIGQNDLYVCLEREEFHQSHTKPNSLFHWQKALQQGAKAFVCEYGKENLFPQEINLIVVQDANAFLSSLLKIHYNNPFEKLHVIGITGTNGKTTTSQLVDTILKFHQRKTGVFGTIGCHYDQVYMEPTPLSNPMATELFFHADQMVKKGIDSLIMEVTSHAMEFRRNEEVDFDVAIFTNFTQDHLDFHHTLENYAKAKRKFFEQLGKKDKTASAIINVDDSQGYEMLKAIDPELLETGKVKSITYGIRNKDANLSAYPREMGESGSKFDLFFKGKQLGQVEISLAGIFNIYNALASIATAMALDIPIQQILQALKTANFVNGRFEKVPETGKIHVYIDYAHTPDALKNILKSVQEITKGQVICVFGCGGDRDQTKRSKMGKIASKFANHSWITSDNPRTEKPQKIIEEIQKGFPPHSSVFIEADRKTAIQQALAFAQEGDSVLIAGKGHETYQIIQDRKEPFSDREEVIQFFKTKTKRASLLLFPNRLRKNIQLIQQDKPAHVHFFAVIKDNGLGFGLVPMAKIAVEENCSFLCVACLSEALEVRQANIQHPILILGERFSEELEICLEKNLSIQIQSLELAQELNELAKKKKTKGKVHFKVDSGMGRFGVRWNEAASVYRKIHKLENLEVEGIMTHFARSDELDKEYAHLQFQRFQQVLEELSDCLPPYRHACNSGGFLDLPNYHLNAVRIGAILSGVYPSKVCRRIQIGKEKLKPIYELKTRVSFCKNLQVGDKVGYGMHFTAETTKRIAVLSIGYGDGYPRLRNQGEVLIQGKRYPIIGGIALDVLMIDLLGNKSIQKGDLVTLVGQDQKDEITIMELADWAGTVTYDIMTSWNQRLERI